MTATPSSERQRVIRAVIANLKEHYIDPEIAQKIADAVGISVPEVKSDQSLLKDRLGGGGGGAGCEGELRGRTGNSEEDGGKQGAEEVGDWHLA